MIFHEICRYVPILLKSDNNTILHEFLSTFLQLVLVTDAELSLKYGLWQKKQLTIKHLAFYKQSTARNRISRPFRDKCRKHDISPFTTEVREIKYLVFYEKSTKCDVAMFMKWTEWGGETGTARERATGSGRPIGHFITCLFWVFFTFHCKRFCETCDIFCVRVSNELPLYPVFVFSWPQTWYAASYNWVDYRKSDFFLSRF